MNIKTVVTWSFRFSLAIMAIAFVVSYFTQRELLIAWGVDEFSATLLPIPGDLLAIICSLVLHTAGVSADARRIALRVLIVAGLVSTVANLMAGETWGARIAHAWAVAAYLLAEAIAAKVKAPAKDAARSEAARKGAETKRRNAANSPAAPKQRTGARRLSAVG